MTQLVLVLCYFHSNTLGRFRNVKKFYNVPLLKTRGKLQENADNFPKSSRVLVSVRIIYFPRKDFSRAILMEDS